jgi:ectoine hydroxylase-related dioxygenase (phytanoyl-CoA dioxygenase family)
MSTSWSLRLFRTRGSCCITFPNAQHFTTPPHQDYLFIQGTPQTYTAWIPLCDCPVELGGLALLTGSHQVGLLPVHRASGPGGLGVEAEELPGVWRTQSFQAGDALIFHSLTIHRALPNSSADRLRLSVDFRYQALSAPVVEDSLLPHGGQVSWEQAYRGWKRKELQYYWENLPLNIVSRDLAIMQPN